MFEWGEVLVKVHILTASYPLLSRVLKRHEYPSTIGTVVRLLQPLWPSACWRAKVAGNVAR